MYAKSGVKYSVEFLQGEEPDDIPTDMLQHPIKVVVPANVTSNATSGDSARTLTFEGLMNSTSRQNGKLEQISSVSATVLYS